MVPSHPAHGRACSSFLFFLYLLFLKYYGSRACSEHEFLLVLHSLVLLVSTMHGPSCWIGYENAAELFVLHAHVITPCNQSQVLSHGLSCCTGYEPQNAAESCAHAACELVFARPRYMTTLHLLRKVESRIKNEKNESCIWARASKKVMRLQQNTLDVPLSWKCLDLQWEI